MRNFLLCLLMARLALPQDFPPPPPPDEPGLNLPKSSVKFATTTQLVVVNISVKDKSGNPVENLKASDFSISEDGRSQQVKVFEYQRLQDTVIAPAGPALVTRPAVTAKSAAPAVKAAVANPISAGAAGEVKYKDRRLLVLFFDLSGMAVADQLRARKAAQKFVQTQLTQSDMVAVMTYATELTVLQDFTNDRDQLLTVINGISMGDTGTTNGTTGSDSDSDTGASYSADDSEFNIFNTDRKLAALESASKMLGRLPEKKALVYFASGMTRTGIDNQAQLRATVNAAVRGNVAFYPVDSRGLVATAPIGDATQASQGGQAMYSGNAQRSSRDTFQAQQETLYMLASDTGGKAMLDTNDLAQGIVQAQKEVAKLLHSGLLQYESGARRAVPEDQGRSEQVVAGEAGLPQRLLRIEGVP